MKKVKNKFRLLCIILSFLWMAGIFAFSARNAEVSTEDSHRIGMWIGHMVVPGFDQLEAEEQIAYAQAIDYPVRKGAHAGEYAILTLLLAGAWSALRNRCGMKYLLVPWLSAVLYAATDEFHQLFVPGRSGQIRDVGIDSLGGLAAVLFLLLIQLLRNRAYHRIKKIHQP